LPPLNPTTLEAETRLARAGIAALRGGNPAGALDLFDEHARSYPNGALAEERAAERIAALCDLDRVDEANRAAAAFIREHPSSPLVARVSAGCEAGAR
jgi:RNA polymerase sigma-70 factor (ECF subfamily)